MFIRNYINAVYIGILDPLCFLFLLILDIMIKFLSCDIHPGSVQMPKPLPSLWLPLASPSAGGGATLRAEGTKERNLSRNGLSWPL